MHAQWTIQRMLIFKAIVNSILLQFFFIAIHNNEINKEDIYSEVECLESILKLPPESYSLKEYARYYKFGEVFYKESRSISSRYIKFRFFKGDYRPGIYIIPDNADLPYSVKTGGGCRIITGIYDILAKEVTIIKCNNNR